MNTPDQPELPAEVREAMPKPPQHLPGVSGNMAETKAEAALTPSEPPPSVAEPTSEGWTRISVPPQPSALDQLTEQAEILGLYDRASPEQVVQPGADSRRIAKEITAYLRRQYDSGYTFDENTVAAILARAFAEKDAEIEHWKSTAENLNAEFARIKDEAKQHDARAEGCLVRAERAEAEATALMHHKAGESAALSRLEQVSAERDQLRAELESVRKGSSKVCADLRAQLAALEASERKAHYEREDARQALELCRTELASAQEDKERLDWLSGIRTEGRFIAGNYSDGWHFDINHSEWCCVNAPTLRAAIDAALKEARHE